MTRPLIVAYLLALACFTVASEQDVFSGQGIQIIKPNGWIYVTPAETEAMHRIAKEEIHSLKNLKLPMPLVRIENSNMDSAPLVSIQTASRIPYTEDPKQTLILAIKQLEELAIDVTVIQGPSDLTIDRRAAAHTALQITTSGNEVVSSRVEFWVIPCLYNYFIHANMAITASKEEQKAVGKIIESVEIANWVCP